MLQTRCVSFFIAVLLCIGGASSAVAEKAAVAVASNFTAAAKHLVQTFNAATDHEVVLSFGSTGKLFTQIVHGAPYDVFLAADSNRPTRAEREGLAIKGSRFTYARGQIVLWSRDPERLDPHGTALEQGRVLKSDAVTRLAMANPKTAPYGGAAVELLTRLGVFEEIKHKIVRGENIAQTYQFAHTGNAEVAIVALSQVVLDEAGAGWVVPAELYSPLDQQAVLLKRGAENRAAIAFINFLKSDEAAVIIRKFGYTVVQ